MAPARGVVEPLSSELACADLLRRAEDSAWLLWKMGTQDPLEQTVCQIIYTCHLMPEESFQPPLLTFIYSKRKPGSRLNQMVHGDHDDPSGDSTRRLRPLLHSSFLSQVTTGCDPVFIPKALSAFTNGMS